MLERVIDGTSSVAEYDESINDDLLAHQFYIIRASRFSAHQDGRILFWHYFHDSPFELYGWYLYTGSEIAVLVDNNSAEQSSLETRTDSFEFSNDTLYLATTSDGWDGDGVFSIPPGQDPILLVSPLDFPQIGNNPSIPGGSLFASGDALFFLAKKPVVGHYGIYRYSGASLDLICSQDTSLPSGLPLGTSYELIGAHGDTAYVLRRGADDAHILCSSATGLDIILDSELFPFDPNPFVEATSHTKAIYRDGKIIIQNSDLSVIYRYDIQSGRLSRIVDNDTPLPQRSGNFTNIGVYYNSPRGGGEKLSYASGYIYFYASPNDKAGLYAWGGQTVKKILEVGDVLSGKVITGITTDSSGAFGNTIVVGVAFSDWTGAFYRATMNFGGDSYFEPIASFQHDPNDGQQAVKNFHFDTSSSQCAFTFSTAETGSICLVSFSRDLKEWFRLLRFLTTSEGTEVSDTPNDPSKFYRTTLLDEGVQVADRFDYPIGDLGNQPDGTARTEGVPEYPAGGFDEINDLYNSAIEYKYPDSLGNNPDRGQLSGTTTEWRNVQDIGSYLPGLGIHAGEDWNLASGEYDIGQTIYATANGRVIAIRPASQSNLGKWGWMMIIRHWLPNGETRDSLYVHIAPDQFNGEDNSGVDKGFIGTTINKQDFTYQEGAVVSRGDPIAVVANLVPSYLSPPNEDIRENWPHLHFELRDKKVDGSDPWKFDNGTGYYGSVATPGIITPSEVQAAFDNMREDGIIDPSDFIDAHRN